MQLHEGRVKAAGMTLLCISASFRYFEMTSHFFNFFSILLLFYNGNILTTEKRDKRIRLLAINLGKPS